jgi:hypothetical protein
VVNRVTHEGEVVGSNPTGHVACKFYAKILRWPVGASLGIFFCIFFGFFCFKLCPVLGTRQTICQVPDKKHSTKTALLTLFLPSEIWRVLHLAKGLPSVIVALPSACESGSDRHLQKPQWAMHLQRRPWSALKSINSLLRRTCKDVRCLLLLFLRKQN